jgi:uncharacterized protein DUF4260
MTATTTALPGLAHTARRTTSPGMTDGAVRTWLRLEGIAAFATGLALYAASGGSWLFIVPLILLPDISAAGYLAGPRVGAFAYNAFHTWVPGILTLGIGLWLGSSAIVMVAAILIAHVGMDRAAGYGLKLPTSFQDTHLGRMGRAKA